MNRRQLLMAGVGAAMLAPFACAAETGITLNGALAFLDVELPGGERASFLLDTGAAATVIDPATLKRVHGGISRGLRLGIHGRFAAVTPAVRDLTPVSKALKQPVAGLLGCDFLSAHALAVDFSAKRFALSPGGQPMPPNGIPMRFAGIPFVQAEVRHGRSVLHGEFGLDTGLDVGVKLKDSTTLPLMGLSTSPGTTVTMEGPKTVLTGTVDALRVGGLDVLKSSAIVSTDAAPRGAAQTYVGTIGAPAFRDRLLSIDFPGGWWSLSPVIAP